MILISAKDGDLSGCGEGGRAAREADMAFAQAHKSGRPLSVNSLKNERSSPSPSPSHPAATPSHTRTKSAAPATATFAAPATSTRRQSNGSVRQSHDGGGTRSLPCLIVLSFEHILVEVT